MSKESATDQAFRGIEEMIARGLVQRGGRLPSERELAARLQVSRVSVRTALQLLRDAGLVVNLPQRGWFVPSERMSEPATTLESFTEMAAAAGKIAGAHVLRKRSRWVHQGEADVLALPNDARVVEIRRLRRVDDTPIALEDVVLPEALGSFLLDLDLENKSLFATLEAQHHKPARSLYTVHADAAIPDWSSLLNTQPGSPVLVAEETCYLADGTPLLTGITRYRGDSYRFRADLFRA